MTFLDQLRRRPRLIRSVFAVFVLAWLQTGILPCAMAAVGTEQAMLAQPSGVATLTAETASAAMPDMPDCVYCPPDQKQSGDAGSGVHDCFYPHESRVDSGKAQQLQLDQLVAHPTFISSSVFSFVLEPTDALPSRRYLIPPLSQRSLNLTHCKQLK
ncbi:MAG: hypothetical protein AB7T07_08825 [Steroidobacteraceae bacterium]